MLGTVVSE
jgi:hypothetical protein